MAILISTPQDLHDVRNNLSGDYELINDIDMSGWGNFTPIGDSSTRFTGLFDGKGFKIKNLSIDVSTTYVGLFGFTENATISNLAVVDANVTSNMQNYVGILTGYTTNTTITNCYTTGQVTGQYGVGGLTGYGDVIINNSFSHATVTGKGRVGGLVGHILTDTSSIDNCYSTGLVTVTPDPNVYNGGLVGSTSFPEVVTNSYWDTLTSGQTISAGGTGLTTTQMQTQSSFTEWDFTSIWGISGDYPYLQVFGVPSIPAKVETITVNSFTNLIYTNVNNYNKKAIVLASNLSTITSNTTHKKRTIRHVEGYLSPIHTNVNKSVRSIRTATKDVIAYINPINAMVERKTKTFKHLQAHIKLINSSVNAIIPTDMRIVNAYVSVQINPSVSQVLMNKTTTQYIINPSVNEVIA